MDDLHPVWHRPCYTDKSINKVIKHKNQGGSANDEDKL